MLEEGKELSVQHTLKSSSAARGFSKKLVTAAFESTFEEAFAACLDYQAQSLESRDHRQAMEEYRHRKG